MKQSALAAAIVCTVFCAHAKTAAKPPIFSVITFKSGIKLDEQKVPSDDLRRFLEIAINSFSRVKPDYQAMVNEANKMTAGVRCLEFFVFSASLASIESGQIDATPNSEVNLRAGIKALDYVNSATQVTCQVR